MFCRRIQLSSRHRPRSGQYLRASACIRVQKRTPRMTVDKELQEFRDLMQPPDTWVDSFNLKAMLGGLFVGLIMTPASMYMQLVTGTDVGPAAQWVTIILFLEVARLSFTSLSRPETYILYYMAGATLISSRAKPPFPFPISAGPVRIVIACPAMRTGREPAPTRRPSPTRCRAGPRPQSRCPVDSLQGDRRGC